MPICAENQYIMKVKKTHRNGNGDIYCSFYCYSEAVQNEIGGKTWKKITHSKCADKSIVMYKNGIGYDTHHTISGEANFPKLINCTCQPPHVKAVNIYKFPHSQECQRAIVRENGRQKVAIENLLTK